MAKLPGLPVKLIAREDIHNATYHIGKVQSPSTIRFKKGVAFFAYPSRPGEEELKISCARPGSECFQIRKRIKADGSVDRFVIDLERRMTAPDEDGESVPFFMGIVQDDNLELDLEDGYIFFVFTNEEGAEELHITKNDDQNVRVNDRSDRPRNANSSSQERYGVRNRRTMHSTEVIQNGEVRSITRPGY